MIGCSKRNVLSKTYAKTACTFFLAASSFPFNVSLVISMYQSAKSFQMKLYNERPASPNSNLSKFFVTEAIVSFKRDKIHLSANVKTDKSAGNSAFVSSSKFMIT